MINTRTVEVIDCGEWDELVMKTYGRPYNFQQQDGCKPRQHVSITIPDTKYKSDYENDTVPEMVNGNQMGVSFKAWLARDPKQLLDTEDEWDREHGLEMFWERNFYPDVQMVANDLFEKGLIKAGNYEIDIDW